MKTICIFLITWLFIINVSAQKVEWADFFYSVANFNGGTGIASDTAGNVYMLGTISDQIILQSDTLLNQYGGDDLILVMYDSVGSKVWHKIFGGTGADDAFELVRDASGNLYASVIIQGFTFMSDTSYDAMFNAQVIQFDSDGNFKRYATRNSAAMPITASDNYLYLAQNSTVEKLDTTLSIVWNKSANPANRITFTDNGPTGKGDISVSNNGHLIVSGYEESPGSCTFDTVALSFSGLSNTDELFVIKMDTSGSAYWAYSLDSTLSIQDDYPEVAVDTQGNVYFSFYSAGSTIYFGNDTLFNILTTDYSAVLKFNSVGSPQWAIPLYTDWSSSILDLTVGFQNELLICGTITGGGALGNYQLPYAGIQINPFLAKINPSGVVEWFKTDEKVDFGTNYYNAVCAVPGNNYAITGFYNTQYQFGCFAPTANSRDVLTAVISNNSEPVPVAAFNILFEEGVAYFENQSDNLQDHEWDFDDGQTDIQKKNPSHPYNVPGVYHPCLTVTNSCGSDSACTTLLIEGIEKVTPSVLANDGYHRVKITGGFPFTNANVRFIRPGQPDIVPDTVIFKSPGLIIANLKLSQTATGPWNLVIISGLFNDTLYDAIILETPDSLLPDVQVLGPSKTLVNTFWRFKVLVTNKSNRSLVGIPLHITIDPDAEVVLRYHELGDSVTQAFLDSAGNFWYIVTDSLANDSVLYASLLLPYLSPGQSEIFNMDIRIPVLGPKSIKTRVGESIFSVQNLTDMGLRVASACNFLPVCAQCAMDFLGFVPGVGCFTGAFNAGCSIGNAVTGVGTGGALDVAGAVGGAFLSCGGPAGAFDDIGKAVAAAADLADLASNISGTFDDCGTAGCYPGNPDNWKFTSVGAFDPNIKTGPVGNTPENYISGEETMQFMIQFENDPAASAPAREVLIYDTLDVSVYDVSTLRFTSFAFGDSLIELDVQDRLFVREIDMRPVKNSILRVSALLDTLVNVITWKFSTYDTLNYDLTQNLNDGFLPPNINRPEGEGYVTYSIDPQPGLPHLQQLNNSAAIIFDANSPVITDVFVNTVDTIAPVSQVNSVITVYNDSTFALSWSGSDAHAGINVYDIYISINDSAFVLLKKGIAKNSQKFVGVTGDKYEFYSIATDLADNREAPPVDPENFPDAVILLNGLTETVPELNYFTANNPFDNTIQIYSSGIWSETIIWQLTDATGKMIYNDSVQLENGKSFNINTTELKAGFYLLEIRCRNSFQAIKLVKAGSF